MSDYQPPALTDDEKEYLRLDCLHWIRSNGVIGIPKLLAAVIAESAVLVKEVNYLRQLHGIEPRPTYSLSGKGGKK